MKIVLSKKSNSYSQVKKAAFTLRRLSCWTDKMIGKNDSKTVEQFVPIGIVKEGANKWA